ncbi:MAG: conjugal transfer protein TrbF [Myxococcota bacterium]|nr:conjugal transfer protein TrbF [Myxococcota bacterium]
MHAPENPYLAARLEWNERYHGFVRAKRNWQVIALVALIVNAMLGLGILWQASQSRVTPYVIEVDELAQTLVIGPAEKARTADPRLVRYQVAEFIRKVRSIVADGAAEKQILDSAYAHASGAAMQFLNDHFQEHNPFLRMQERTVSVEVTSVLPLPTSDSWQIQWTETHRGLDGAVLVRERWQALVSVEVRPSNTPEQIEQNPLGLYVTNIQWTKQL